MTATEATLESATRTRRLGARAGTGHVSGFRPDVQGLRAVAVVLVVGYHAHVAGMSGGFVGVDVFFVISGYVIGASMFREVERTSGVNLSSFYGRRARRLLPAFVVMAVPTLVLSVLLLEVGAVQQAAAKTAIAATFSVSNLYQYQVGDDYFATAQELNPFLHTWSLGVEEQFYLVAPAMIVLLLSLAKWLSVSGRRAILVGLTATSALSFVASAIVVVENQRLAFLSPLLRFWEIGVGMVLAAAGTRRLPMASIVVPGALATLLAAVVLYGEQTLFPGTSAIAPVAATALLISTGPGCRWWSHVAEHPVSQWVGDRSYGWYLWHWPFVVFAREIVSGRTSVLLVASLVALVPTALSYRLVEVPVRALPRLRGRRLFGLAVASICGVTAMGAVANAGAGRAWGIDAPVLERDNISHANGCHANPDGASARCEFAPPSESVATVLLLGDSHAASMSDGVVRAAESLGWTVVAYSGSSCMFTDIKTFDECGDYRQEAWRLIRHYQPDLVITAHASAVYVDWAGTPRAQMRDVDGSLVDSRERALQVWQNGLSRTKARLDQLAIGLVSIDIVPVYSDGFDTKPTLMSPNAKAASISVEEVATFRDDVRLVEHAVLDTGHHIDVAAELCDSETCSSASADGIWFYFDPSHLNRAGSLHVTEILESELRRIAVGAGVTVDRR